MASRGAFLLLLLLLVSVLQSAISIGYPSPCDERPQRPNDLGPGSDRGLDPGQPPPPPTVAFLMAGGIPSSQPGLLGFHRTVTNVNARIQQEYGSFIAEIPGLYLLTFTAVSDANSHVRIALRRNKQTVVTAFAERSGYQSASQTAIIELSVDDVVYLQVEEGCIFESTTPDQTYASFSGLLVAPSEELWPAGELRPPAGVGDARPPFAAIGSASWPGAVASWPGVGGAVLAPGGLRWPSPATGLPLPPGAGPQVTPGGENPVILPPGPPRTPLGVPASAVLSVGAPGVPSLPELPLGEQDADGAPTGPVPSLRRLIPRPPHSDVTDLAERTPERPMRFPDGGGGDVTSRPCCGG